MKTERILSKNINKTAAPNKALAKWRVKAKI